MSRSRWIQLGYASLIGCFICSLVATCWPPFAVNIPWLFTLGSSLLCLLTFAPLWNISQNRHEELPEWVQEQQAFRDSMREATEQMKWQAETLQRRERELADRFLQYQSWMEYPIDEQGQASGDLDRSDSHEEAETIESLGYQKMLEQDRELTKLLEQEAERLFNKIKENAYAKNGKFQPELLRDDLQLLLTKIARVYHPDSENPFLETSIEQLLRMFSRTSLHMLVLLERLPINLAEHNLQSLYNYVRQGLRAYQVYQSLRPLLPYVNYATYAGRFVLGANPIALGAQWALWKLGSEGASVAVKHLVNRQALSFLHDSTFVVGYEMAGLYGGDIRHRNKHWTLGVELSELLSRFPLARESLLRAFAEVGRLPLSSEYDRVFLYRCIAAHRSGGPHRYHPKQTLTLDERRWVTKQLSHFIKNHLAFRDVHRLTKWQAEVHQRLGVAVSVDVAQKSETGVRHYAWQAAEALVSFLLIERQSDLDDLDRWRSHSKLLSKLSETEWTQLKADCEAETVSMFDLPDLDPSSPTVVTFVEDMAHLTALTIWEHGANWEPLEWAAEFFQIGPKRLQRAIHEALEFAIQRQTIKDVILPKMTQSEQVALLEIIPPEEKIACVYTSVSAEWTQRPSKSANQQLILVGWGSQLVLMEVSEEIRLIWSSGESMSVGYEKRILARVGIITGGTWQLEGWQADSIRLQFHGPRGAEKYFEPLQNFYQRHYSPN